jgi:hypothetical protein
VGGGGEVGNAGFRAIGGAGWSLFPVLRVSVQIRTDPGRDEDERVRVGREGGWILELERRM